MTPISNGIIKSRGKRYLSEKLDFQVARECIKHGCFNMWMKEFFHGKILNSCLSGCRFP
jgi:hypothetical protein